MLRTDYKGSNWENKKNSQEAITVSQARDENGLDRGSNSKGDEKYIQFWIYCSFNLKNGCNYTRLAQII